MRLGVAVFIAVFSVLLGVLSGQGRCLCSCAIAMVSSTIGWAYFSCWSLSFWPQTILNWYRKSVVGLSFDFVALNLAGFTCYAAFNCALYWNPTIKAEYSASHDHEQSAVKANDVFFALHACAVTALQLAQIGLYERGGQRFSIPCKVALVAILAGGAGLGAAVGAQAQGCGWLNRALALAFEDEPEEDTCSALTLLYLLSYVKLAITLTKCAASLPPPPPPHPTPPRHRPRLCPRFAPVAPRPVSLDAPPCRLATHPLTLATHPLEPCLTTPPLPAGTCRSWSLTGGAAPLSAGTSTT